MRLLTSIFLIAFAIGNLNAQEAEFRTEMNVQLDANLPDSMHNKVNIIVTDILSVQNIFNVIFAETEYILPDHLNSDVENEKLAELVTQIIKRYSEEKLNTFISELLQYYLDNFTLEELTSLKEFYQTPLGKKTQEINMQTISTFITAHKELNILKDEMIKEAFPLEEKKKDKE